MISSIILFAGLVLLVVVGIGYVIANRDNIIQHIRSSSPSQFADRDLAPARVPLSASVDAQFADLHVDETVEINPDRNQILQRVDRAVTCRITLQALNRQGREFTNRGEAWPMFVLDDEVMLFKRPDGWKWFEMGKAKVLDGESAREFDEAGIAFCDKGQSPRCDSFTWRRVKLTILDVGYLRVELKEGACHLENGEMIKYMLAEDTAGNLVYLENLKVGTDRIWMSGSSLGMLIKPYVGKLLRAAA